MSTKYPVIPDTLLIISLKMYFNPHQTLKYLKDLLDVENHVLLPQNRDKILLALIPDFLSIWPCSQIIRSQFPESFPAPTEKPTGDRPLPFLLGAQDCFWEDKGAYTGEISPLHLSQLGVSIVEIGHAERRDIFNETDEMTAKKATAISRNGMIPLVCIGEIDGPGPVSLAVKQCETQVKAVLDALDEEAPVIFAYEPVWAIGRPHPASVAHVEAVVKGVRELIGDRKGTVKIIYGGSAGPGLWSEGGLEKAVDGMFLGRFAHQVDGVRMVIREIEDGPEMLM
ncbi:triosephosphate isomerase [Ascosphaera apis ARSEF 7405]|uniref:Triosephosphate isomerase n=1 Tax=Ascosphaera apis ARSEF 7405 TaxID=392613 RepID=A0A167VA62_9EURO|nr:triosephosphate isomerase [Ascosphaera apis ARSEF 7405]